MRTTKRINVCDDVVVCAVGNGRKGSRECRREERREDGKRGKKEKGGWARERESERRQTLRKKLQRTTTDTTRLQHSCEMGDAAENGKAADATAVRAESRRAEEGRDMALTRIPFRKDHWVQFVKYKKPIPLRFSVKNVWLRIPPSISCTFMFSKHDTHIQNCTFTLSDLLH